jgi:hypothetical protein
MEGPALPVPVDTQRLVTAIVLADLAGLALARSDPHRPGVAVRDHGDLGALKASGAG